MSSRIAEVFEPAKKPLLGKFKYVDFEVIKEPWNTYALEDGTRLRAKMVLTQILQEKKFDEKGRPIFGGTFEAQNLITAKVPEKLRRKPTRGGYSREELLKAVVKDDMEILDAKENWNEYKLADGVIIRIKNSVVRVSRTEKYNNKGEPIYLVDFSGVTKAKIPEKLKKKYESKKLRKRS